METETLKKPNAEANFQGRQESGNEKLVKRKVL